MLCFYDCRAEFSANLDSNDSIPFPVRNNSEGADHYLSPFVRSFCLLSKSLTDAQNDQ